MQVDWFTVAAEIVNFLILVVLLKKLLYDRILAVADAREEKIASRFEEAEEQKAAAEKEAERYRQQRQEFEEERDALLENAREAAEERRHELIREARSAVEAQQEEWYDALAREQHRFLQKLHRRAGEQFYAVTRRALADLADADLEQQVINAFLERLRRLDADARQAILSASTDSTGDAAEIRTAFPLPDESQDRIVDVIHTELSEELSPSFAVDEELLCGIALRTNGQQVTWNVDSYLDQLEQRVQETLEEALRHQTEEFERVGEEGS